MLMVILLTGLFIQGIYRKPPSAKNKKLLKEALEQGNIMLWCAITCCTCDAYTDPQGTDLDNYDMHCITSIVTAFLGQLPSSLISPFLYKDFIRAAGKYCRIICIIPCVYVLLLLSIIKDCGFLLFSYYKCVREVRDITSFDWPVTWTESCCVWKDHLSLGQVSNDYSA